jgi:hypothetical protein
VNPDVPVTGVGIYGQCPPGPDDDPPGTFPPEECVFTVEAVQYRRYQGGPLSPGGGLIKFNAVCVDTGSTGSNLNGSTCSPVEREPLAFGVGLSIAPAAKAEGGAAAGLFGGAYAQGYVGPALSIPIVFQRRLRYPLFRRYTGIAGGNILIESGIGSIVARETVVFDHTPRDPDVIDENPFHGNVRFFVTKPVGMDLTVGYLSPDVVSCGSCSGGSNDGDPCATDADCGGTGGCPNSFDCAASIPDCQDLQGSVLASCPPNLTDALRNACGVGAEPCPNAAQAQVALGPLESDFDIQEVIDALDNETQAIADITEDLKVRIEEKITKVFEIVQGYLGPGGGNPASAERSVLVDKMMSLLRDRITNTLDEIRGIARDLVACPQ